MTLPVIRQKNAAQIRMTIKDHAEQIKSLSLVPIRGPPNATHGRNMDVVLAQYHFQTNPLIVGGREQMIVNFKPRFLFGTAIEATQIGEKVKLKTRSGFKKRAHINDVLARDDNCCFAQRLDDFADPFGMLTL